MTTKKEILAFREATDCLEWRMKQNSRPNTIHVGANESLAHYMEKCRQCYMIAQNGGQFYTEAVFKDGKGRADIYTWDENGEGLAIEIVHTEDISKSGKEKYPCRVRFIDAEKGVEILPSPQRTA